MSLARLPSSFRDPSGFVFRYESTLYRAISDSYREHYDELIRSGLYDDLTSAGLLIPHEEVTDPAGVEGAYRVLRPEPVDFVSYPYEWCFGQLKAAALCTLEIQNRALACGMILKDASAFNIQFHRGRPILIDTLSFERYREGAPWIAYRQYCQHFLAPLLLMAKVDVGLLSLLREHLDGVPLELASRLLAHRGFPTFSRLLHIHLHARSIRKFAHARTKPAAFSRPVPKTALLGLVDSLRGAVQSTRWEPAGTPWADYERTHRYDDAALADKHRVVGLYLERLRPATVWDLGANTGEYSRLAAGYGARVLALDGDPAAVELNYRRVTSDREPNVLPLLVDLANPTPRLGWNLEERMSLMDRGPADAVLALALTHHLAITNNLPFEHIAAFFRRLAPSLIIEFVPKGDEQAQRLLVARKDIFTTYTREHFERTFREHFLIDDVHPLEGSGRVIYLMQSNKG